MAFIHVRSQNGKNKQWTTWHGQQCQAAYMPQVGFEPETYGILSTWIGDSAIAH